MCFRCDGVNGASINRLLSPVRWFVHPLSRTHSLTLGWSSCRWISATYELIYFISEEYGINFIISISSSNRTDKAVWGREKWKFISSWLACVLSRILQVSSKFFRRLSTSGDLTLQKRLVLFLHHPHLKGWQRVHHSASSIWERWQRSQCRGSKSDSRMRGRYGEARS